MIKTFADITDTVLAANQTKQYTSLNSFITGNTITSASTGQSTVREITDIELIPPVSAGGAYEDLREVWLSLDNHSTQHYVNLSGVGRTLMFPLHSRMWGGRGASIRLGTPLWQLIQSGAPNMALLNTTLKYASNLTINVHTIAGVTGAGSGGWRAILKGYEYDDAMLADLAKGWNNQVSLQTQVRRLLGQPPLNFTFVPSGPLSMATFTSYPGGTNQGAIKINPYWHHAYNNAATQPQTPFNLSNFPEVAGGQNNVEDEFQDLGLPFRNNEDALILHGFGIQRVQGASGAPGQNLSRFGWWIDGDYLPEITGNQGFMVSANVNDYAFGDAADAGLPVQKGLYLPVPRFRGQLLVYHNNAVPFIGASGSPIPVDAVCVAMNGVLVERG